MRIRVISGACYKRPTTVVAKLVKSRARDGQSSPRLVIIGTPIRDVLLEVFCVAV